MSVITFPDNLCVASFRWKLRRNELVSRSTFGSQSLESAPAQWIISMTGVPEYWREAVAIEQFLEALAGFRNQTEVYHRVYPVPFGTLRGALTLDANALDGATSLAVDAGVPQAGKTLLQGDLLGLGAGLTQQVLRVAADCVVDGAGLITVPLNSPLRTDFAAGASVVWDHPKVLVRQMQDNAGIEYVPKVGQPWALDFIEDTRP